MTARNDLDLVLHEWFATTAHEVAPTGLHDNAIERVRASGQQPAWIARLGVPGVSRQGRASALVPMGAILAVVALALVWAATFGGTGPSPSGSVTPSPSPSLTQEPSPSSEPDAMSFFTAPFDFTIPPGSGLVPAADGPHQHRIAWVVGQEQPSPSQAYGGQAPESGVDRGIIVASADRPWAHSDGGRYFLKTAPAGLLSDLADTSGAHLGPITAIDLDGRPALAATVLDYAQNDIHLSGGLGGLIGSTPDAFGLGMPCRLIVANVDGQVVFVLAWARTPEDLDGFLPTAAQFVDSMRFTGQP